jgi:hypothetical protein
MIADEVSSKGSHNLRVSASRLLFLLLEGNVDCYYRSEDKLNPKTQDFHVGKSMRADFAISAFDQPWRFQCHCKAALPESFSSSTPLSCKLFELDPSLLLMMTQAQSSYGTATMPVFNLPRHGRSQIIIEGE